MPFSGFVIFKFTLGSCSIYQLEWRPCRVCLFLSPNNFDTLGWTESSAFIKVLPSRRPFTGSVQIDTGEVPPHGAARCCHYRLLSWLLHRRPKKGEKKRARVFLIVRVEPTSCTRRLLNPVVVRTFSAEKETLIWVAAMLVICNGHREL